MKLYKVTLRGLHGTGINTDYGTCYVVATDPTTAYNILRAYIEKRDLGFDRERELNRIELIAEEGDYPACNIRLMIQMQEQKQGGK
jgi:hypothetical protein